MNESSKHSPGAWAVTREDTPQVFLAENQDVMSRLLALKLVAAADPSVFTADELDDVREHLLHERWAAAVVTWMDATETFVDVYPEYMQVWTEKDLDREVATMAIRMSRIFDDAS